MLLEAGPGQPGVGSSILEMRSGQPGVGSSPLEKGPGQPGMGSSILGERPGLWRARVRILQLRLRHPEWSPLTCRSAQRSPRVWFRFEGRTQPPALAPQHGQRTTSAPWAVGPPSTYFGKLCVRRPGFWPSWSLPTISPLAHRANSTTRFPPGVTQAPSSGLSRWTILRRERARS